MGLSMEGTHAWQVNVIMQKPANLDMMPHLSDWDLGGYLTWQRCKKSSFRLAHPGRGFSEGVPRAQYSNVYLSDSQAPELRTVTPLSGEESLFERSNWILTVTFSKESTVYTVDSPVKVMNANCFHKFTAGTMKQHLLINLRRASFFLELSLFPKTQYTDTEHTDSYHKWHYKFFKEQTSIERVKQNTVL